MTYKNSLVLFAIFMAAGFGGYLALQNGFYPAAIVNFNFISAQEMNKTYFVAYRYFQNVLLSSGKDVKELEKRETRVELRRATVNKLITDSLIYQELKRRIPGEFNAIAEKNINEYIKNNADLEKGAKLLYGIDFSDFKEQILLPQAYQEILEGRMFLNNESFNDWLAKERSQAKIFILLPDLKWEKESIILRN